MLITGNENSASSHKLSLLDSIVAVGWKGILQICCLSRCLVICITASLISVLIQHRKVGTFGKYLIDKVKISSLVLLSLFFPINACLLATCLKELLSVICCNFQYISVQKLTNKVYLKHWIVITQKPLKKFSLIDMYFLKNKKNPTLDGVSIWKLCFLEEIT